MSFKNRMRTVHIGEILRGELDVLGMSVKAFAKALDVPVNRITAILNGQRVVTSNTVLCVVRYFRTTLKFWLNLEKTYELRRKEIATSCRNAAHVQL